MQIPPAEIYSPKVLFKFLQDFDFMEISFHRCQEQISLPFISLMCSRFYYDSSVAHKEIIPVIKQPYKFGKCTAHRLFGFVRTMNMYAVLKNARHTKYRKALYATSHLQRVFQCIFLQRKFSAKSHQATYQALHRCTASQDSAKAANGNSIQAASKIFLFMFIKK